MIITVGGIKGGTGKTTVAVNLAIWLSKKGLDVLLVDADEQASATKFTAWRDAAIREFSYDVLSVKSNTKSVISSSKLIPDVPVNGELATQTRENVLSTEQFHPIKDIGYTAIQLVDKAVSTHVMKMKSKYDHVIIDTGGRDTTSQRAAMTVSDIVLLPFQPRSMDFWTTTDIMKILQEIWTYRDNLKAMAFINRADARGQDNKEMADALRAIEGLHFIDHLLGNRKAFSNAAAAGLSVMELEPADEKANNELNQLFNAIIGEKVNNELNQLSNPIIREIE